MLPILHLGPVALQTPGLVILIGIYLGLSVVEWQAVCYEVNGNTLSNLVFLGLVSGVIVARLAFAIHYSSAFIANPNSLISLNLYLFEPVWGIGFGLFIASFYGWRKHMPFRATLDALTTGLAVFAISFHLAQLASGDGYGSLSSLPWAVDLWGINRHPVQIYEALVAVGILWMVWPRLAWFRIHGQKFLAFIAMSAGARLFLDAFRGDSVLWAGFRSAQVVAWLVLATSLWAFGILMGKVNNG